MPGKIIAGREDVHMLKIRVDGELSQLVSGGQFARRGTLHAMRVLRIVWRKSNWIVYFIFWASQIELYFDCLFGVTSCTHMTVTIFYVLDSLEAGQ